MLLDNKFGNSGARVVIENSLTGEEFSRCAVNGDKFTDIPTAQDPKRAYDGDKGLTLARMGAYAPVPHCHRAWLTQRLALLSSQFLSMIKKVVRDTGPYGLILTADGPKNVEFNSRLAILASNYLASFDI